MNKPIYCGLAFGSASINGAGEYIPCCNIRTTEFNYYTNQCNFQLTNPIFQFEPYERINAKNLKIIREQLIQGKWPSACANCKNAEDAGVMSMRTIWNKYITDAPMVEHIDPKDVKFLDLTFSTKCNSKCMTCGPGNSDFWEEEWHVVLPKETVRQYRRVAIDDTTASKLIRDFPNVTRIAFIGGEPTISEEHVLFLRKLIEKGTSKIIELSYVTNLTGMTEELISIWQNFKHVGISVSIDGYQKTNEYIRYPFKWSKTESNLRSFLELCKQDYKKFGVGLSCTHSIFNAIQAPDLLGFWYDILTEYDLRDKCGVFLNRVSEPPYLMVNHLSKSYRNIGIEKIKQLENRIEKDKVQQSMIDAIKQMGLWLAEPWSGDIDKLHVAHNFIHGSDKFRNRNIGDYIPELLDEIEKIIKLKPNPID